MRRRIAGGIFGWLIGVVPLLSVNLADYFGYYFADPIAIGAIALFGGLLLGGIASGFIGGRSRDRFAGGPGASIAGGIAAILYAISIIASVFIARTFDALPPAINEHPIRISVAVLFFAALLLGIAMFTGLLTGLIFGQSSDEQAAAPQAQSQFSTQRPSSQPRQRPPSYPQNRNGIDNAAVQQRPAYRQSGPAPYNTPQRPAASAMPAPSMTRQDNGYADAARYPRDAEDAGAYGAYGDANDSRRLSKRPR